MYFTFLDMIHLVRTQNFSEILHFLPFGTHTHTHTPRVRIRGQKILVFWKILRTH